MVELLYGMGEDGRLLHVDSVPNGLACGCRCPGCGAMLVAKNNGETVASHFAHASGSACTGAHESELHLLAKEIIGCERRIMLPAYGTVYAGGLIEFDRVEVEQRHEPSSLRPDLCGLNGSRRLWIEIRVTHAIGAEKRELIRKNGIACVEIDLSDYADRQVTRQELAAFLMQERAMREWTNNPVLEEKRLKVASLRRASAVNRSDALRSANPDKQALQETFEQDRQAYLAAHAESCIVASRSCYKCRHHTTRSALLAEARRRHLPAWVTEVLQSNLLYWARNEVEATVSFDRCWQVRFEHYVKLLPTASPDMHGREVTLREIRQNEAVVSFLLTTVPAIIDLEGMKCSHNVGSFRQVDGKYDIACNMPNVVNRHRRKAR